ncbi:MAG: hypothetical protein ACF8XB_25115 [Planctomycetota bacterium JB042]
MRISTRHARPAERRRPSHPWLAALVVFGHLAAVFHAASTEHSICVSHGVLEHVGGAHADHCHGDSASSGASAHHHDHAHGAPAEDRPDDGPAEEHDACAIVLASPAADRPAIEGPATAPTVAIAVVEPAADDHVPPSSRRYLLAPKTSPPLVG